MNLMCITWNICCLLVLFSSCLAFEEQASNNTTKLSNVSNIGTAENVTQETHLKKISVPIEGGSIVRVDETHSSREGKVESPPPVNEVSTPGSTNSTLQIATSTDAGGAIINKPPTTVLLPKPTISTIEVTKGGVSTDSDVKPVYEVGQKNDGKNSVSKKEPKFDSGEPTPEISPPITPSIKNDNNTQQTNVTLTKPTSNATSTTIKTNNTDATTSKTSDLTITKTTNATIIDSTNATIIKTTKATTIAPSVNGTTTNTVKEKPKKPLFTEAVDDNFAPSHFVSGKKAEQSKKKLANSVPSLENIEKRKSKSANYVVPIVAIILSVPLVTIIISLLYKRTAEWWHHRHYRRMDFLIEGMYNN